MKHCLYLFLCMAMRQLWKEERSKIRDVQIDNLRGLLGIRRIDRVPNAWIRVLHRVMKEVDERIDESVLWCFSHVFVFYYGLTSICNPMVDILFISWRGSCVGGNLFLRNTTDSTLGHSGGNE